MADKNKVLTPEEMQRKEVIRKRLLIVLVAIDILLIAYLVFELISVIKNL